MGQFDHRNIQILFCANIQTFFNDISICKVIFYLSVNKSVCSTKTEVGLLVEEPPAARGQ